MLFNDLSTQQWIALTIALIPAFTLHEFAHAWMAYRLGDPTAKNLGRLTLNPLKHLDVLGTLMIYVTGLIGWAKPVPVNPNNLRSGRRGMALVAAVGPVANLVIAVVAAALVPFIRTQNDPILFEILVTVISMNIALMFFNFIPIPPLDGYRVVLGLIPEQAVPGWLRLAQYGPFLLLGLLMLGWLSPELNVLGKVVYGPTQALTRALLGL